MLDEDQGLAVLLRCSQYHSFLPAGRTAGVRFVLAAVSAALSLLESSWLFRQSG
jgi:hypothetical protein